MPDTIKAFLFQVACSDDWWEFMKAAEESCWLCFPENKEEEIRIESESKLVQVMQEKRFNKQTKRNTDDRRKKCIIHGTGNHTSEKCRTLQKLKEKGLVVQRERKINQITEEDQEINKSAEPYYITNITNNLNNSHANGNAFRILIKIRNRRAEALLDTGADISLISLKHVPDEVPILKNSKDVGIFSASNNQIDCIGKVRGLRMSIGDSVYIVNAYVTRNTVENIILGRDFIEAYPKSLYDIINVMVPKQIKVQVIQKRKFVNELTEEIIKKHEELFKDEITANTLCTRVTHKIDTGDNKPRRQYNGRIPVHIDKLVSEEIDKLLSQRIISTSNSPWV